METFDTNVLVRLLVRDDEDQCRRAEAAWRAAITKGGVLLPTVVLVEGPADLSDYVILEVARSRDALPLQTFDERLALADGAKSVP